MKKKNWFIFAITLCAGLGGMLYGYDIGVISGALTFMQKTIHLTTAQQELIVGAVLAGGLIGTLITGSLADWLGRRTIILAACIIFMLGTITIIFAHDFTGIFSARLLLGIGVGIIAVAIPLYLSEIAPPNFRGRSVTMFQIFLTAGIMIAYLVDLLFTHSGNWRAMFALLFVPTIILLISMILLPETPRWLLANNQEEKARATLNKMNAPALVEAEVETIKTGLKHTEGSWKQLFNRQFLPALFVAVFIAICNQLTGINVILQYAPKVMSLAGLQSNMTSMLATLGIGTLNFLTTIVAMILIDHVGRKKLLIIGTSGLIVANIFLALVSHTTSSPALIFAGLITYIIFFAVGPGVVVWLAISELLPTRVRGRAIALCLFTNSLTATCLSSVFLTLINTLGMANIYWIFAICTFFYLLTAIYGLPETKGQQLEEIQAKYQDLAFEPK